MNQLSPFLLYSVKVAIALALLYLPYRLFLVQLTFYRSNRYYLLGYSVLSLLVPLLNLGPVLPNAVNQYGAYLEKAHPVQYSSTWHFIQLQPGPPLTGPPPPVPTPWYTSPLLEYLLLAGIAFMLIRLLVQVVSFLRTKGKSTLLQEDRPGGIRLYSIEKNVVPFSLGKSIFVHFPSHEADDMRRIVEHESAHIRQWHTFDILFIQLLTVFQWWNPFIWLLQSAVRQNLEFLADKSVLEGGEDRKKYQYLLLNVSGIEAPLLSNSFNRSPLKRRIVMMNKERSHRVRLTRFLFGLPLLVLMLAAFSHHRKAGLPGDPASYHFMGFALESRTMQPLKGVTIIDSVSGLKTTTDDKGYFRLDIPIDYGKDAMAINAWSHKEGMDGLPYRYSILTTKPCSAYLFGSVGSFVMATKGDKIGMQHTSVRFTGLLKDSADDYINKSPGELIKSRESIIAEMNEEKKVDSILKSSHQIYYYIDGTTYVRNDKGVSFNTTDSVGPFLINDSLRMTGDEMNRRYTEDQVVQVLMLDEATVLKKFGIFKLGFVVRIKEKH